LHRHRCNAKRKATQDQPRTKREGTKRDRGRKILMDTESKGKEKKKMEDGTVNVLQIEWLFLQPFTYSQ